jgi:dienelactone hydrolase
MIPLVAAVLMSCCVVATAHAAVTVRAVTVPTRAAGNLHGALFASGKPAPGVLILHTAAGLKKPERIYARKLAEAGFTALVVAYKPGWLAKTNTGLAEALDWLVTQPEARGMPLGVVGFSLGGSKALLVAALRRNTVKAVVAYYATYDVEASKFKAVARKARQKSGQATPSPVQIVGQIDGAVLLLNGGDDDETDPRQTAAMEAALEKANKTYELKVYQGAVHMFDRPPPFHPRGNRTSFGTATGYNAAAAENSWQMSLAWLNRYLRGNDNR